MVVFEFRRAPARKDLGCKNKKVEKKITISKTYVSLLKPHIVFDLFPFFSVFAHLTSPSIYTSFLPLIIFMFFRFLIVGCLDIGGFNLSGETCVFERYVLPQCLIFLCSSEFLQRSVNTTRTEWIKINSMAEPRTGSSPSFNVTQYV